MDLIALVLQERNNILLRRHGLSNRMIALSGMDYITDVVGPHGFRDLYNNNSSLHCILLSGGTFSADTTHRSQDMEKSQSYVLMSFILASSFSFINEL